MTQASIFDVVQATLNEMGLPAPDSPVRTILLHDRCFVGEKYRFDGGYVVWLVEKKVVEVFDNEGKSLKTIEITTDREAA